jgi:glycosyltransferase involved in cell wall biosynthesis
MPNVYLASDVVVQTCDNEGTPVALIEAQAASLPVVATGVGGVASAVVDGETGRITVLGEDIAMPDAISNIATIQQHRESAASKDGATSTGFTLRRLIARVDRVNRGALDGGTP